MISADSHNRTTMMMMLWLMLNIHLFFFVRNMDEKKIDEKNVAQGEWFGKNVLM